MRRFPSSWFSTLEKLGYKRRSAKPRPNRLHGYGRRPTLELLESRQLLTGTPWIGTDVLIGDFNGDGNLDRLGSTAVSSISPEIWSIDTKSSSAAGNTEDWRVIRPNGYPAAGVLPTPNESVVGDFNGDGRDDILSRTGMGWWYVIHSRASSKPTTYQGEFEFASWGPISISNGWSTPVVGDFDGDGRDDLAAFNDSNPADKQWQVMRSTGSRFEAVETWAQGTTAAPITSSRLVGDFNGDGRDDIAYKKTGSTAWTMAISDGSRFNIADPNTISTTWTASKLGDFDGNKADEILGWNPTLARWEIVNYSDRLGMGLDTSWGNALGSVASTQNVHIGDANRDGRDDLVIFDTTGNLNKWKVALSQKATDGTNKFVYTAADVDGTNDWFKNWDWGPAATSYRFLNVDAPYQEFVDIFSNVYNTIELELYPGFMKGLTATAQTKSANPWEQAALLVDRLESAGFSTSDVEIASGTVEVPVSVLKSWLGLESNLSVYNAIRLGLDGNAVALNSVGVNLSANSASVIDARLSKVRFRHAWVQAKVPTALGWTAVNIDPSWKFKDFQPGFYIDLSGSSSPYPGNRGTFDEFDYLAKEGDQLPLEYYENRVAEILAANNVYASLAEVPHDGPIIQRHFTTIPSGLVSEVVLTSGMTTYNNFAAIVADPGAKIELTHRVEVSLKRDATSQKLRRAFDLDGITQLPDYAAFEPSLTTSVGLSTTSVSSYGEQESSAVGVVGQIRDLKQTAFFPNPYPTQGDPNPPMGGFGNFIASDYTINSGSGAPGEIWFQKAAAYAIELSDPYDFTANTRLEFDIEQSGSASYNPTFVVGVTRYSTGANPLPMSYDFYLIDGTSYANYTGEHSVNVTHSSGQLHVSIPAGAFASDNPAQYQTRITILHSDNVVRSLRESGNQSTQNGAGRTTIRNLFLREESPYDFTVQGNELQLTGTSFVAAAANYVLSPDSIIEFEFLSTSAGDRHIIGWDVNGVPDSSNTDSSTLIAFFGNDVSNSPYTGNGWEKIRIPLASYFSGTGTQSLGNIIFGVEGGANSGATSYFRNIKLFDGSTTLEGSGTSRKIIQSGFTSKALPASMTLTRRTLLQFTFNVVQEGRFHGIGIDYDNSADNGGNYDRLFYLSGTNPPTGLELIPITGSPFHGTGARTVSIPIGDYVGNVDWLDRIVFVSEGGKVEFSDISIVEGAENAYTHWSEEIVVPATPQGQAAHDVRIRYEGAPVGQFQAYIPYLSVNGDSYAGTGNSNGSFFAGESSTINVQHWFPTALAKPADLSNLNRLNSYSRTANQVHALVIDANQYSTAYIAQLQYELNEQQLDIFRRRTEGGAISDVEVKDSIGALLSYVGSKYWHEVNFSTGSINGLLQTVGAQQRIGSGLITSDAQWIADPNVGHLNLPNVPRNLGVDFPNVTHNSLDIWTGPVSHSSEAFQLIGYNSSALESAILEEVVNTKSISTIRGLKESYAATVSGDHVWVFESRLVDGQRKIYRRGSIGATPDANDPYEFTGGDELTASQIRTGAGLSAHSQLVRDLLAAMLENANQQYGASDAVITVTIPHRKSIVDNWAGSVYLAEIVSSSGRNGRYVIAPDNGPISSGGYIGGVFKPENNRLSKGTFLNETYAGDPVNVANGNMFRDDVDFTFANPVIPLDFARHYDTQNKLDVGFGVGWVHSFTGFIYEENDPANSGDKDYIWLRGNGERHTFENLNFKLPNTLFGDIETNNGPVDNKRLTAFKDRSGTQYIFEPLASAFTDTVTGKKVYGRLIAIKDATGNQGVTITYEPGNSLRVAKVSSIATTGRSLDFVYSANSVEVRRVDGGQLASTWAYVLATHAGYTGKRLTQVKHANQSSTTTTYTHYTDGPASRKGLIKEIIEPNGESHSYEYYANGRVFRVTDGSSNQQSFNYNLFRNLTEFTDERGNVETYIHQDNGLLTKQIHNDRSRLEFTWGPQTGTGPVQWEEFLMKSSTDERGGTEIFTYYTFDPNNATSRPGELQTSRAKDGVLTTYEYANHAYISSVKKTTVTPLTGPSIVTSQQTYDPNGRILTTTDAEEHTTSYEYFAATAPAHLRGLRKSETQAKGVPGQSLSTWEGNEAVGWETLTNSFTITGDTIAVRLLSSNVLGEWVRADAIRIDRLDKDKVYSRVIDDTTGTNRSFRLESTTYTLDTDGAYGGFHVRFNGGTAQPVATWIFDDLEPGTYRISASWPYSTANDPTTSYQLFDDLPDGTPNQVVTGIDQLAPADSFRNYQTLFEYDTAGNVTRSITEALPAGRRAYDSFGNVVYEEDATGAATAYTYDTLGRLTTSSVVAPKAFKFTPQDVVSYGPAPGWDVDPTSWEVQNGGDTLYIYNGARKAVPFSYRVTANTVLEFDFEAIGNLAEVHGIGFSNALATVTAKTFALGGTNPSGWIPEFDWTFATYKKDSGQRHFRIPVGQILAAGTYNYLAFVNYDSGNYDIGTLPTGLAKEGKSYFSNLRIYESATSSSIPYKDIEFTPSNVLSNGIGIGLDEDPNSWKVLDEGRTLHLFDGARKAVPLYYQVTPQTVLEFDFKADGNLAELHGVGLTHSLGVQTTRTFAVAGTSPNTWMPEVNWSFKNYSPGSGVRHFRIPVGQFVSAGMYEYLAFVNYDHGNTPLGSPQEEGKSYFSNVRLHEGSGLPSVNTTTHTYDASGRLKATTDGIGRTTTFDYDGNGRLIRTAFADGTFTTHEYDELGNCIAITDELGHTTHHVYDDRNRVVQTIYPDGKSTRTRYDGVGQIVTTIDEREVESAFTFDKVGRLLTTIAAKNATEQAKTVNKYDGLGRRIESVDGEGNVTKYLYDDRDRLIQTTVLDTTHISPSDTTLTPVQPNKAPVYVSTIEYDANGSIARTAVFDPRLFGSADYSNLISNAASLIDTSNEEANKVQVVRFAYNALGRSTKVTNADGKPTSTTYDAAGRVRFTFDELGRKTEHLYDAYGRLQKIIQPDPDGAGPGERPYVRYVRNAAGEMIYEAEYVGPGHLGSPDLFETVREFAYDERGRSIFLRDKTGIVAARHAYDAAGKLVSTIDAERNASLRTYDERGRVLAERAADPDGAGKQIAPVTRYAYDPAGNLAATTDPLGNTTEFAYDKLNRRVTESHTQTLIVDDVEGGSSSFSTMPSSAAETATGASSAFGNDATYFVPNGSEIRQAEWTFTDLDAGDYVISLSSFAVIFSPGTTLVEVLVGGTPFLPASSSLSQLTAANEYRSIHGESDIAWRRLPVPVPVPAGGSIKLRLSTNGGSLLADAVRIDRIVSESFGYDKNGNRTSATDTRGNATTYVYDELNRVRQTISADPDGAAATLRSLITESTYDGYGSVVIERQGHLTSTTTYDTDRTNTFKYDQRNRLTEKVVDAGAGRLNVTTHYRYDSVGYTTDVTNALGDETHFRYDNLNRVIDEYQDFGEGRTDALFTDSISVTPYTLDPPGQPNITFNSGASFTLSGYASKKLAVNHTVKYNTVLEFEFRSHSQAEVHLVGFDANGTLEQGDLPFMFDLTGTTTIPGTNREFRVEHVSDEVVRFHIPIGQYLSDAQKLSGLPINFLTFTNVDNRNWLAMADRSDSTFSNIRLYDSDEVRTVTTYDLLGNVETVREASDPRNITTRYEYDRLSRLVRTDFDDGGPQEIVHTRAYDTVGNLIEERNNTAGTVTIHVYDRLNRRIKSTLPDPDANPATFNGLINQFTYDAVGNVVKQEQKAIQVVSNVAFEEATKTIYDSFGRIIVETDGNGDETHYRYDSEGNLLSVTDAEQNTTSYKYDRLNRVTEETNAHGTRRFEYSKAGNLDRLYNRISGQIQFSYDTLDRKIAETWRIAAPGSTVQRFLNWQYDKLGRITKQVDGNTQTEVNVAGVWVPNTADDIVDTFVYDGLGRLIEERNYDPATLAIEGQNSDVPRVRQTYRFVVEPTSSGTFVDRTYRDQFASPSGTEVIVAQTQFQSDRLGRLTDQQDSDPNAAVGPAPELKHLRFTYDPTDTLHSIKWFGNFAAGNWTNTATSGFGYDGAQRLTSLSFAMTSAPALVTHTYGYNNASRVTSFNTTGSGAATRSFAYDKASQLTSKTGSSGNEAYTYDDNGNRVAVGAQTIVTGLANRLINDGTYGYIYDNEGNVVRRVPFQNISASNPVVNYFYDRSNRLASVMQYATWSDAEYTVNGVVVGQNAIHVINYTYDAQGRRVRRSIDADGGTPNFTHETFIYSSAGASGNELTMRFTGGTGAASVLTHRYMHGPDGQALVDEVFNAAGQSTEVLWLLTDQQGTVRDVVNDNGVLRKHVDYDSFGKVTGEQFYALNGTAVTSTHAEAIEQLFGYTGQERDKTTGLQKHGARWYNPSTARWLSEDPIAFAGGDPNLYRYVGNSPLNAIDPTGLIQAGNPLSNLNLFAGGYSGGSVSAYKPPSPYVASGGGLSLGTLGSVIGNSIFNAAASYVAPETKTAIGTLNVASSIASTGGFLGDSYDAFTGYSRGVKDSIDRSFKSAYNGVAYAVENPLGAIGSVASGAQNTLFTALDYTIGWTAEHKRNQNIRSIEHTYNTLHNEFNRLKDASVYEQARTIGDVVGTGGQAFVPATTLARTTRVTSTLRLPAIGDDVAQRGAISQLTVLNGVFVPDSKKLLQQLSNQAYADISMSPRKALQVLTDKEYRQLVYDGRFADAQFGNAIERLVASTIEEDARFSSILVHSSPARHHGQFVRTPDFVGIEGSNYRAFDLTTIGEVPVKLKKPGSGAVEYVIQPGKGSINFK